MGITPNEFNQLRDFIRQNCGIHIGDDKTYLIESRLTQLLVETGAKSFGDFYLKVKQNQNGTLRDRIVDAITTNETLWFRDGKPWTVLREQILPEYIQMLREGRKRRIRIWSAACSTGQEPYSLAITIDSLLGPAPTGGLHAGLFEIIGTDISPSVLFLAISGRYNQIEISRGLDESIRTRYFTKQGAVWILDEAIRKRVTFKRFNLQDNFRALGTFDLILCRNAAIYFNDEFKRNLFRRIAEIMEPRAPFLLGSAESLSGYSNDFDMQDYKGAIYYRRKAALT